MEYFVPYDLQNFFFQITSKGDYKYIINVSSCIKFNPLFNITDAQGEWVKYVNATRNEATAERSRTVQGTEAEIQAIIKNIKSNPSQYPDDFGKFFHIFCQIFSNNASGECFFTCSNNLQKIFGRIPVKVLTAWKVSVFGVFLVRVFLHLERIRRDTLYLHLSVFSPNAGKYGPENPEHKHFSRSV